MTAVFCAHEEEREAAADPERRTRSVSFYVPAGEREEELHWWKQDAGHRIVFLPSCVDTEDVRISLRGSAAATIGGIPVKDGMDCGLFRTDVEYEVLLPEQSPFKLCFLRSANLPVMYIHTVSGTTDTIHTERNVDEYAEVCIIRTDGTTDYYGPADQISGRGSGSWIYDKKSYNLKLNRPADLLDMGNGSKWVLLANVIDESHLRNKTVYDFAREIESYPGFAPDCEYVDVFLNGEYAGLYLLSEKAEIAENRVEADPETFLIEIDALGRSDRMNLPFTLDWGLACGIRSPKTSTEADRDLLMNHLFEFQETLEDPSAGQEALSYIDTDSWSRRYLIEEIFENYDAGSHSQFYFWNPYSGHDNRIFAGPCWDYDNCADSWFMAKQNPRCFLAQRMWKNDYERTPWYGTLMQKEDFRNLVLELYRTVMSPKLHQMLDSGIAEEAERIAAASRMNALRWNMEDPEAAVRHFLEFMRERVRFLDSAWIDGVEYRTITAKTMWDDHFYCTEPGTACTDLPKPEELYAEEGCVWIREDTGEVVDSDTIIRENFTIIAVPGETAESAG